MYINFCRKKIAQNWASLLADVPADQDAAPEGRAPGRDREEVRGWSIYLAGGCQKAKKVEPKLKHKCPILCKLLKGDFYPL